MSLLIELNLPYQQLEEALDTLAELPFAIDPVIREAPGRRASIEFAVAGQRSAALIQNTLLGSGLLQVRVQIHEAALA